MRFPFQVLCLGWGMNFILGFSLCLPLLAGEHSGKAIYTKHCASCHGEQGQGVEGNYSQALIGSLSVRQLTEYIDKSMPEGETELCVGEEAKAVAEYIHREFYSSVAQYRNQPPRIDLARLTVPQYRHALADLAESFTQKGKWDTQRGLRAEYYSTNRRSLRRFKDQYLKIERIDAAVDVDFGEGSADPETIPPKQYCVYWYGGLLAPETGTYEFILKTANGGRLWVNQSITDGASGEYGGGDPLIDAVVKSENSDEYRASMFLIGGRVYPIQVEFNKSSAENAGAFQLKWKRPQGADEVISSRFYSPNQFRESIIVGTPFPPDDKNTGYERGNSISREWANAMTFAAVEFADKLMANIYEYAELPEGDSSAREEKLKEFCYTFVERAFRQPLSDEIKDQYVDRQFERSNTPLIATKRVILLTLRSPRFLFPSLGEASIDQYHIAERLALTLWDSVPDEELRQAARDNQLQSREQLIVQAKRMVQDERTKLKIRSFFHNWWNDSHHQLTKSSEMYPGFDQAIATDLRTSLDLLIEEIIWEGSSSYQELLTTNDLYFNKRLADFYGIELPAGQDFQKVAFEPEHRSGLLTHPYLLSSLAYHDSSSPIHRGVFLARSLVGRRLNPPPVAVSLEPAELHPNMTTRERVELQTSSPSCYACHSVINPLGFALENFDAVGRFRELDRGKPVNTHVVYIDQEGQEQTLKDAKALATFLAESPESHAAFVEHLFRYVVKQPPQAFGAELLPELNQKFRERNYHIQDLLISIVVESVMAAQSESQAKTLP